MKRFAVLLCTLLALTGVAFAQEDAAPASTISADGKSATDGKHTLSASQTRDLPVESTTLTIEGKGYNEKKGIYVAFCVIPPNNTTAPTPCGGGQDRTGSTGGSVWVSSNPPLYARGLTTPYGKGGTFKVQVAVQAMLNEETDCRVVRCAIATRNDHTVGTRDQDIILPVYFQGGFAPPALGQPTPAPVPTTTIKPGTKATTSTTTAELPAPVTTVSDDAKSVSGGGLTLGASQTAELSPNSTVKVIGNGFDMKKGVYVSLCFISEDLTPDPCAAGSADQSAWISSNPPSYGKDLAKPYGSGGTFSIDLKLDPVIDAEHDCRVVACALASRNDDTHPGDRSQDLMLPVSFGETKDASTPSTLQLAQDSDDSSSSSNTVPLLLGVAALVAAAGGGVFMMRRRQTTGV